VSENDNTADTADTDGLTDLQFVGASTASTLRELGVDVADVEQKTVSYRQLVDAGVNPGVATKIRREHSLHWNLDGQGEDLDNRSDTVRGLQEEERAWVAESQGDWQTSSETDDDSPTTSGDWTPTGADAETTAEAEADGSGGAEAAESAWRDRSRPDPVTDLDCIDQSDADLLAVAGVSSVRRLATADPESIADVLQIDEDRVAAWCDAAEDRLAN
jgi:predicted flap endonuclease-1-like 5' DNA nuclease